MKRNWLSSLGAAVLLSGAAVAESAPAVVNEPYGACAHVSRGEWPFAERTFDHFQESGIRWVRTDFDWKNIEPQRGTLKFDHLDRLVKLAKEKNIGILPILDYDVPWATPAWKNLDLWSQYVNTLVSRYQDQLPYWEVWNEQNSPSFWRDDSSGRNYAELLKRTYQEIKKINPELTVLYGGTAGVPLPFIEDSLKAGAGDYFDVMNIHPYHWRGVPEMMFTDLSSLQELMEKYGVGEKPIWITEVGWATAQPPRFFSEVLPPVFDAVGIDPSKSTLAIINDPVLGFFEGANFNTEANFAMFGNIERIPLSALQNLDVKKYPVLVPSTGEEFPMAYFPQIYDYVKRGGTLVLPSGLPFYHDFQLDGKGTGKMVQVNDKFLKQLHIGWETWWTTKGVPNTEEKQYPAPRFAGKFDVTYRPSGRFLTAKNLKKGDEFIPVIQGVKGDYEAPVMGLYRFNSELKGNAIVYAGLGITDSTTEKRQAEMLPRTYLIAMANGVERIFWFNFRAGEWQADEREDHFGIVHKDLSPKPAYHAYRTLTRLCPDGSTVPEIEAVGLGYLANWTRPDGVKVWAIWSANAEQPLTLDITGDVAEAVNHLGEKQTLTGNEYRANPSILYLAGPEKVAASVK